jgi:hypothetical protein
LSGLSLVIVAIDPSTSSRTRPLIVPTLLLGRTYVAEPDDGRMSDASSLDP